MSITKLEIEARKRDFIEGIGTKEVAEKDSIWSLANLRKLTPDELLDRIEQIDNQAFLYTCRLLWELRQRFPSDIHFGQYIEGIRSNPDNTVKLGSQPRINKMLHVGRFCDENKISDISKSGILQSAIVELSRPANKDVASVVLHEIRRANLPLKEVLRLIEQKKAVFTIEKLEKRKQHLLEQGITEEEVEAEIVRHRKYTVNVDNGVIEGAFNSSPMALPIEQIIEAPESNLEALSDDETVSLVMMPGEHSRRHELLRELADLPSDYLTEEEKCEELLLHAECFNLSFIKLIVLFQLCVKRVQAIQWKK